MSTREYSKLMPTIDRTPVPKYYIIKNNLVQQIEHGEFGKEGRLPTESELCALYNVSRITIRKALDVLQEEKYIYRIQGKGTYVNAYREQAEDSKQKLRGCTNQILIQGKQARHEVLKWEVISSDEESQTLLGLGSGPHSLLVYNRIYYADNVPAIYAKSVINLQLAPGLSKIDISNTSLMDWLSNTCGYTLERSNWILEAVLSDEETSGHLNIPMGHPLIKQTSVTNCLIGKRSASVESHTLFYNTDVLYYTWSKD